MNEKLKQWVYEEAMRSVANFQHMLANEDGSPKKEFDAIAFGRAAFHAGKATGLAYAENAKE